MHGMFKSQSVVDVSARMLALSDDELSAVLDRILGTSRASLG
jgi:hypothetical protein